MNNNDTQFDLAAWELLKEARRERDEAIGKIEHQAERIRYLVLVLARANRELDAKVKQMHELANALERILAWKGGYEEEEPESIAVNALASLKGGNP